MAAKITVQVTAKMKWWARPALAIAIWLAELAANHGLSVNVGGKG